MNVDEAMASLLARSPKDGKSELLYNHATDVARRAAKFVEEHYCPNDDQEKSRFILQDLATFVGLAHDTVGKALSPYQDWFNDNTRRFDPYVPHHHQTSWLSIRILQARRIIAIEAAGEDQIITALASAVANHHLCPVVVVEQPPGRFNQQVQRLKEFIINLLWRTEVKAFAWSVIQTVTEEIEHAVVNVI